MVRTGHYQGSVLPKLQTPIEQKSDLCAPWPLAQLHEAYSLLTQSYSPTTTRSLFPKLNGPIDFPTSATPPSPQSDLRSQPCLDSALSNHILSIPLPQHPPPRRRLRNNDLLVRSRACSLLHRRLLRLRRNGFGLNLTHCRRGRLAASAGLLDDRR